MLKNELINSRRQCLGSNMNYSFMDKNPSYAKYKIGRYTYGNPRIEDCWNHPVILEIGSFCSIAGGVTIWLGGNHHTEWVSTSNLNDYFNYDTNRHTRPRFYQTGAKGNVIIGNDVWIGLDATILSGVAIGDGAVVGAKAVVASNIPSYSIAVGNPARVIKKRFTDEEIQKLLNIRWWNWDDEKIKENIPLILNKDISGFISKFDGG